MVMVRLRLGKSRLARAGMIGDARPYRPLLDRPNGAPAAEMLADLAAGRTDAVILWAPLARHFARVTGDGLAIAVLRDDGGRPALSHPVRLAVRRDEDAWRDLLDKVLAENEVRIQAMLRDHGVLPDAAKLGG